MSLSDSHSHTHSSRLSFLSPTPVTPPATSLSADYTLTSHLSLISISLFSRHLPPPAFHPATSLSADLQAPPLTTPLESHLLTQTLTVTKSHSGERGEEKMRGIFREGEEEMEFDRCNSTDQSQVCNMKDNRITLAVGLHKDCCIKLDVCFSDTIGDIKEWICDKYVEKDIVTFAAEPDQFQILLYPGMYIMDRNNEINLGQFLDDIGFVIRKVILDVRIYPSELTFKQPWEYSDNDEEDDMYVREIENDEESSNPNQEEDTLTQDFIVKRPSDGVLPADSRKLRVTGFIKSCRTTDQGDKTRFLPCSGGLPYPLECVTKLITPASFVLLAFNCATWSTLIDFSIEGDTLSKYLLLQVSWDKFSYLFLRKLRQTLGPHVPFVVVTDLDVRHIELATFLDTPPQDLPEHYGWDLSKDCARLDLPEYVDIKWLGIRPSECLKLDSAPSCKSYFLKAFFNLSIDFRPVRRSLFLQPHFTKKSKWVEELRLFTRYEGLRRAPWNNNYDIFTRFMWASYLPKKIEQQDWI